MPLKEETKKIYVLTTIHEQVPTNLNMFHKQAVYERGIQAE